MLAQIAQQGRDPGTLALRVEGVDELVAVADQFEAGFGRAAGMLCNGRAAAG